MHTDVCVCVRACVRARARVRVCVCVVPNLSVSDRNNWQAL